MPPRKRPPRENVPKKKSPKERLGTEVPHADFGDGTTYGTTSIACSTPMRNQYKILGNRTKLHLRILRRLIADKSKPAEEEPKNRKEPAEWAKASQIYKDALSVDREMTREETKRARENFDKVNGPLKEPPALTPSGKTRNTRQDQRTQSFELYEDFLYYQNPAVRRFLEKKNLER